MIATASDLSATAARMLDSLPSYYAENQIIWRIIQAWANEVDRIDGLLDTMKNGLVPGLADDTLALLSIWERTMGILPSPDAPVAQRQSTMRMAWQLRIAESALQVMNILGSGVQLLRNTPSNLEDTIVVPYAADSYVGAVVVLHAQKMWPAHRVLHFSFSTGFLLDRAEMDRDEL